MSFCLEGLLVFSWRADQDWGRLLTLRSLTLFALSWSFQIIGRVNADPDYLPRATDFGLNISGFLEHYCPTNCPRAFFPMAAVCCDLDADKRSDTGFILTCNLKGQFTKSWIITGASFLFKEVFLILTNQIKLFSRSFETGLNFQF